MVFGWEGGGGGGREKGRGSSRIGGGGSDGEGGGNDGGDGGGSGGGGGGGRYGGGSGGVGEGVVLGRKGVQVSGLSDWNRDTGIATLESVGEAVAVVEVGPD